MKRKKGDLPGRYVPPHIRRWPHRLGDYVNVAEYQERVEPTPSPLQPLQVQGELDLDLEAAEVSRKDDDVSRTPKGARVRVSVASSK